MELFIIINRWGKQKFSISNISWGHNYNKSVLILTYKDKNPISISTITLILHYCYWSKNIKASVFTLSILHLRKTVHSFNDQLSDKQLMKLVLYENILKRRQGKFLLLCIFSNNCAWINPLLIWCWVILRYLAQNLDSSCASIAVT